MNIAVSIYTKRSIVVLVMLFAAWWYLQSWVAYRHVTPSEPLTEAVINRVFARFPPPGPSRKEVAGWAWQDGAIDTTAYIAFKHYPPLLCCLVVLAVLAFVPDRRRERKTLRSSNKPSHRTAGGREDAAPSGR
jgi:hypothetical protein